MTRHRIAQIGENRNPKSPETRPQTRPFLQIRLLQLRRSATPFNGLAVLHGRPIGNGVETMIRMRRRRVDSFEAAVFFGSSTTRVPDGPPQHGIQSLE